MLSADERNAFHEIRRHHTERVGAAGSPRPKRKIPTAFVVLWWVSVLIVIFGAVLPGLGMAVAVGLGWLLWRYLPDVADTLDVAPDVADDGDGRDPR